MNDTTTGGFISPEPDTPLLEGDELEDFIQLTLVGVTGLDPTLVRPRFQPESPTQPSSNATWLAFGINGQTPDANAYFRQVGDGTGSQYMQRQEEIELMTIAYGPNGKAVLALLRDGLAIPQNRELLRTQQIAVAKTGVIIRTSELMNGQYVKRHDMMITLRRQIERTYSVRNIDSLTGVVRTEDYIIILDTTKEFTP